MFSNTSRFGALTDARGVASLFGTIDNETVSAAVASDPLLAVASIIPSPGPRPAVNRTDWTLQSPSTVSVPSGTVISGEFWTALYYGTELTNSGAIWSANGQVLSNGNLINHGLIVGGSDRMIFSGIGSPKFTNYGQIFALGDVGTITAINSMSPLVINNGLLAAQALRGEAITLYFSNGGTVMNGGGGRILAEGVHATAIHFRGDGTSWLTSNPTHIDNAGLISAASLGDSPSIGIWAAHSFVTTFQINNTGVIRADVAVYGDGGSTTTTQQMAKERVVNSAAGRIEGAIVLMQGDDIIENRGLIRGYVQMGEGADLVDTRDGVIDGVVDLGWQADSFLGSDTGDDRVTGHNGDDRLEGNGGQDLLMGGGNNDVIIGGAGNDGLFGEYGDDRLVTSGGDVASGGSGDDRIEVGDYAFELVSGDEGEDTLVLPGGARALDLSAILAQGALHSIEVIELGGAKEIVIRSADVALLTDGSNTLRIEGGSTDRVNLVGDWAASGVVIFDGVACRSFVLDGKTVLVKGDASIGVSATSPTVAGGLDATAPGPLAPLPGEDGGLDYTSVETYLSGYALTQSVTVNAEELWWNDGGGEAVVTCDNSGLTLTNHGMIASVSAWDFPVVTAVEGRNMQVLVNYGDIYAGWTWEGGLPGEVLFVRAVHDCNKVINNGRIVVEAIQGGVQGLLFTDTVENHGQIIARSTLGTAVGVDDPRAFINDGSIYAEGLAGAVGVHFRMTSPYSPMGNAGRIEAVSGNAESIGVQFQLQYNHYQNTFFNTGSIIADVAVSVEEDSSYYGRASLILTNEGSLVGRVEMGTQGDTLLNSGAINGVVNMGLGADTFDGRAGTQSGVVNGGGGADTLSGGVSADRLDGGADNDRLDGGAGDDLLIGGAGADTLNGGDGVDTAQMSGARSAYTITTSGGVTTIVGADGTDTLTSIERMRFADGLFDMSGAPVLNRMDGAAGPDNLSGTAGPDLINGGAGDDALTGAAGADRLNGDDGNDVLNGGGQNDLIDGGHGRDTALFAGLASAYTVSTVNGVTTVSGPDGVDTITNVERLRFDDRTLLVGGSGGEYLGGAAAAETLTGTRFADELEGFGGNDTLNGGDGDDLLRGGQGVDVLNGGAGIDTADYSAAAAGVRAQLNSNSSTNDGDGGTDTFSSIENLTGSAFNDTLIGDANANVLRGGLGADTLLGLAGNDVLWGGSGLSNTMQGGLGDDRYILEANDSVVEVAGEGNDTIEARINAYVLAANVENLVFGGTGNFAATGNAQANTITGGSGNDNLRGRGGVDVLNGGAGTDTVDYTLAAAGVTARLDTNRATNDGDGATDSFTGIENLNGSVYNDLLIGNAGNNVLHGGIGTDTLLGFGGDDILRGKGGNDTINGGLGKDEVQLRGLSADYTVTAEGNGWRVVDAVAGRDGSTLVQSIEVLRFANNTTRTLAYPPGAATLEAEGKEGAQVGPLLDDDAFVLPALGDDKAFDFGPQVLPDLDHLAGADASFTALVADRLSQWMDEVHHDGGLAATPDPDALGAAGWRHDWMS